MPNIPPDKLTDEEWKILQMAKAIRGPCTWKDYHITLAQEIVDQEFNPKDKSPSALADLMENEEYAELHKKYHDIVVKGILAYKVEPGTLYFFAGKEYLTGGGWPTAALARLGMTADQFIAIQKKEIEAKGGDE